LIQRSVSRSRARSGLALIASIAVGVAAIVCGERPAAAAGMDPTPERLVLQPAGAPASCQDIAANPEIAVAAGGQPNSYGCRPDNVAFRNVVSELGFAIAPTAFHPARTTGLGGFALTLEASFTHINADASSTGADGSQTQYWHQGTQGSVDPNTNRSSIVNNSPDSLLALYSLKARKGLPLGFELTGSLGYLSNTTMWVIGGDVRWALLEGFRTGPFGYVPDISVGGGVRTLTGSPKLLLTTVGIDAQVSKPFTLADSAVLTPYIGYQRLIIFGNSTVVDTTPNVDALQQCGYAGNYDGETDPITGGTLPPEKRTGAPACRHKLSNGADNNADFNNNVTFDAVRIHRHRGIIGLNYRYEILYLAGQVIFDLTAPDAENSNVVGSRQWTTSLEAGVFF
jgi:hypothetical protein